MRPVDAVDIEPLCRTDVGEALRNVALVADQLKTDARFGERWCRRAVELGDRRVGLRRNG
jgi:hypothetical protein